MQKQLGIRMRAKRAAMLAENTINIPMKDDDEIMEEENDVEDDSMDTTDESNDATSDAVSTMEKDNVKREQQNERETSMSSCLSLGEFANRWRDTTFRQWVFIDAGKRISTKVRFSGDGEETEEEEEEDEQDDDEVKENTNPPSDPNRPSLKVIFTPIETRCFHRHL